MRKALDWKAKLVVAGILAIFAGFIFYIDWIWDTQGQNLALSQIALFVAIIVAIVALWSLKTTRDSLELTRATTRPFVTLARATFHPTSRGGNPEIELAICNTGVFPANEVSVELELILLENDGASESSIGSTKMDIAFLFPKEERYVQFSLRHGVPHLLATAEENRMVVRIEYQSAQKKCKTLRTLHWPTGIKSGQRKIILEILKERDYWD